MKALRLVMMLAVVALMGSCDYGDVNPQIQTTIWYQTISENYCEASGNSNALVDNSDNAVIRWSSSCFGEALECHTEPGVGPCAGFTMKGCNIQTTTPDGQWGIEHQMASDGGYNGWLAYYKPIEPDCDGFADATTKDSIDYLIRFAEDGVYDFSYYIRIRTKSCDEGVDYGKRWMTSTRWPDGSFAERPSDGTPRFAHSRFRVVRYFTTDSNYNNKVDHPVEEVESLYQMIGFTGMMSGISVTTQSGFDGLQGGGDIRLMSTQDSEVFIPIAVD